MEKKTELSIKSIKNLTDLTLKSFEESIESKHGSKEKLVPVIAKATSHIIFALKNGKKILACGNGGSAADAQHFAAELVGRYERERKELPAIALTTDTSIITAIGNDYGFNQIYEKQVRALGNEGDILLAISSSGNSNNVLQAIEAAQHLKMIVIAMTGKGGGKISEKLSNNDVHICVPYDRTARIQEIHLLAIHCICEGIDTHFC